MTLLLAFGLRGLLPSNDETFWLTTGILAIFLGRLGSITMAFIRRDLGVKESGAFIIGRDDLLSRLDGLVFLSPAIFYAVLYLKGLLLDERLELRERTVHTAPYPPQTFAAFHQAV